MVGIGGVEASLCLGARGLGSHSPPLELFGAELQVQAHLLVQLLLGQVPAPDRQPEDPPDSRADHASPPRACGALPRIPPTVLAYRRKRSASSAR